MVDSLKDKLRLVCGRRLNEIEQSGSTVIDLGKECQEIFSRNIMAITLGYDAHDTPITVTKLSM